MIVNLPTKLVAVAASISAEQLDINRAITKTNSI